MGRHYFSSSNHNYSEMAASVRDSDYMRNIPPLPVECVDMDGDQATWPLIFEDFYEEWSQGKKLLQDFIITCVLFGAAIVCFWERIIVHIFYPVATFELD